MSLLLNEFSASSLNCEIISSLFQSILFVIIYFPHSYICKPEGCPRMDLYSFCLDISVHMYSSDYSRCKAAIWVFMHL
jgi:hypothetical protein